MTVSRKEALIPKMKKILPFLLFFMIAALLCGCGAEGGEGVFSFLKAEKEVGADIPPADVTEFIYTYENINFNAEYRRYRFYVEDGKYMFFFETRQRENEYGPTTPDDVTSTGTVNADPETWARMLDSLRGGTVTKRSESTETGGAGPWTYLYWKNDKNKYQQFEFRDLSARTAFEALCVSLAEASGS